MATVSGVAPHIDASPPQHPLGKQARVLLSSVFGPYAQDDEYGSRAMNPMELYHNQVTRDARAVFAADVSSQLGPDADPGEHRRALRGAGLSHAGSLHRGDPHAAVRRDRHHRDHSRTG